MSSFTFKKFTIEQDRCAMKVGTDGVLLGAWARGGSKILDIGTGTGLISLMMAQRFPMADVSAIDIDKDAVIQARENIANSPFYERIKVENASLQEYAERICSSKDLEGENALFDAIVSNPPYFENSLKNPDSQRTLARHTDSLSFASLVKCAYKLLSDDGMFSVVLPADAIDSFMGEAYIMGFTLSRKCLVKTTPQKAPKRVLLELMKMGASQQFESSTECMLNPDGSRSEWYSALTREFYIR